MPETRPGWFIGYCARLRKYKAHPTSLDFDSEVHKHKARSERCPCCGQVYTRREWREDRGGYWAYAHVGEFGPMWCKGADGE